MPPPVEPPGREPGQNSPPLPAKPRRAEPVAPREDERRRGHPRAEIKHARQQPRADPAPPAAAWPRACSPETGPPTEGPAARQARDSEVTQEFHRFVSASCAHHTPPGRRPSLRPASRPGEGHAGRAQRSKTGMTPLEAGTGPRRDKAQGHGGEVTWRVGGASKAPVERTGHPC